MDVVLTGRELQVTQNIRTVHKVRRKYHRALEASNCNASATPFTDKPTLT